MTGENTFIIIFILLIVLGFIYGIFRLIINVWYTDKISNMTDKERIDFIHKVNY